MGHFVQLSSAIKTVLSNISDPAATFADIQELPSMEFSGYPAATIAPSNTESDYANIVQNLRTYAFNVDIFYPVENPESIDGYAEAFAAMRGLMDITLDAFDNSNCLDNACQILRPAPSVWLVVETGSSTMVEARITLRCALTVSTNNG